MKRGLKILSICLICFLLIGLTSCGNSVEKNLADVLKNELGGFKSPDSVSLISVLESVYDGKILKIRISGENSYGGIITTDYYIVTEDFSCNDELFDLMYADEKNEIYDGSSGDYNTWYDFHKDYYGPGGTYEWLYGKNFFEFRFLKGDMYQIHDDYDDRTLGEGILAKIFLYLDSEYNPSYDVGKINQYLNEYKEEMGWR